MKQKAVQKPKYEGRQFLTEVIILQFPNLKMASNRSHLIHSEICLHGIHCQSMVDFLLGEEKPPLQIYHST